MTESETQDMIMTTRTMIVLDAIKFNTWICGTYEAQTRAGEPDGPIARSVLPFRMFETTEGDLCFQGYDTYRNTVRTFRLDRWIKLTAGEAFQGERNPNVVGSSNGEVTIFPVAWHLYRARPQSIKQTSVDKFVANGWALVPPTFIVQRPAADL